MFKLMIKIDYVTIFPEDPFKLQLRRYQNFGLIWPFLLLITFKSNHFAYRGNAYLCKISILGS